MTTTARGMLSATFRSARSTTRRAESGGRTGVEILRTILPSERIALTPAAIAGLVAAPGAHNRMLPAAVALPETTAEVAAIVRAGRQVDLM